MAAKILEEFKQKIVGLELQPAGGGCYEISVDGALVYSKLETGEFPVDDDIIDLVRGMA